jgi:hypothetical protein
MKEREHGGRENVIKFISVKQLNALINGHNLRSIKFHRHRSARLILSPAAISIALIKFHLHASWVSVGLLYNSAFVFFSITSGTRVKTVLCKKSVMLMILKYYNQFLIACTLFKLRACFCLKILGKTNFVSSGLKSYLKIKNSFCTLFHGTECAASEMGVQTAPLQRNLVMCNVT